MWQFATEVLWIDKQRLWVSYFKGDELNGELLAGDKETYQAWLALGASPYT